MHISLSNNRIRFDVDIYEKYTLLTGDSGTGKTTFWKMAKDSSIVKSGVKVNCIYKIIAAEKFTDLTEELVIYVIDENSDIIDNLDRLTEINAYFIIISRKQFFRKETIKKFKQLSISVTSVIKFITISSKHNVSECLYKKFNSKLTRYDILFMEDSESSFSFFKQYFDDYFKEKISAKSKDNIIQELYHVLHSNVNKRILVVYDSSAFGMNYEAFCSLINNFSGSNFIDVLDWESFEDYLLGLDMFDCVNLDKCTPCIYDSREKYAEDVLLKCVGYKKSVLYRCFNAAKLCSKCSLNDCKYSYSDKLRNRDFYIKSPLTSLYTSKDLDRIEAFSDSR